MKVVQIPNGIQLEGVEHFNIDHTFLCGQCFRWDKNKDGSFEGVAFEKAIKITQSNNDIFIYNTNKRDFENIWLKYLDLDKDYSMIKAQLSKDEVMTAAIGYGWGIRILQQELWECLVSFIISSSNNIPRIKRIIASLCQLYGKPIKLGDKTHYTFPSADELSGITEQDLAPIKAGFRAKYIVDAVNKVNSGLIQLEQLKKLPLCEAKKSLMQINGVGPKVADCVLLFGCGRYGAFPVDVWIDRAMRGLYPCECEKACGIRELGENMYGDYCGLAQQYIFYYARENNMFK